MKLSVAIQMDHVSTIDIDGDSTFVLGMEAEKRGYALWHYTPSDLIFRDRKVMARAQPMKLRREKGNHFTLGAPEMIDLSTIDANTSLSAALAGTPALTTAFDAANPLVSSEITLEQFSSLKAVGSAMDLTHPEIRRVQELKEKKRMPNY